MEKVLKYTENGVNFDSVKIPQILYEHGPLGRKGKIEYNDDEVTHIDDKSFINAVDIDWNGIEVENNNRINTTADLINWIKSRSTGSSGGSQTETISVPITCYRWYHIQDTPNVPTENSEEPAKNDTYEAVPEFKWSKYAINRPEGNNWVLYLCSGTKEGKSYSWRSVTRISGIDGSVGEDSKDREWIYKVFNEEKTFSFDNYNPNNWDAVQQDDYFGPNGFQWSDNPQGVSIENKFEYTSYRDYKNGNWTKFSTPILWSHYGVNGIDGDGVEYCYVRTVSKEAPEVVVNNIENELTDEYKPLVKIESLAGYNNTKQDIKGEGEYYQDGGYSYTRCTDDPKGVDGTFQYEWVIVRKKDEPNDNGTRKWKRYSGQMSLWSSFTVNVDPAITIKDGFLWGDGDYIRDGDGNPIKIEGGDGSQGVETIGCPDESKTYKPGTISVCENKVKIYYNDQWIDFGEGSGSGKYIHIAYAKSINFDEHKYNGFSTTNSNDGTIYDWMGIKFDDSIDDPTVTSWEEFKQYKWNYIKGRDGNGVEYVFLLTKEEVTSPGINQESYDGHNNQDDEFYPRVTNYDQQKHQSSIWTDDPQQGVSETWPKLWKAIRKKVNGVWQSFGDPKIENQYFAQTSAYIITSDNDNILLDDQSTDKDIIRVAAAGNLELKYGTQTINNARYYIGDHNLPNHLVPITNGNSFNLEYNTGYTAPDKFNTGQYHFTIRAKLNANDSSYVAQKQFNVIIKDISIDGSFYKLVIENDSQSYDGNKNSYNNNAPIVHVQKISKSKEDNKISISEETNISITTEIIDSENPGNPENISKGLVLYIPESLFTVESTTKYDSPIELNNVTYQKGGYDIVLYYYNGEKLELLGYEHIDCVKDGKDADISDGITIKRVDRYYQATNTNNTYPNSHKGHENENDGADGWWRMQSDAGWSASNPYLYIQDRTFYNNGTNSWGPVELYSYWGNENYDLVVSPQHIILDEKVNEKNEDRSYLGTNTVTVTLYKSGTEDSIIPRIQSYQFFIGQNLIGQNLIGINNNNNTKTATITININNIKEYLKNNNSVSEGYLSFTVEGYEVYDENKIDNTSVFIRQVKVPVYINRAESKLFGVKDELISYIEDQGYITETRYTADISATQKTLRSEYTEKIKYAEDRGRNLFGFNKGINWQLYTTLNPVIPFIQGYGIVVKGFGTISNIGIEKIAEDTVTEKVSLGNYTVSFSARTSATDNYSFVLCGCYAETAIVGQTIQSNPQSITIYSGRWVDVTLNFDLSDISKDDYKEIEKLNGVLAFTRSDSSNNAYLYVRHLKIELGDVNTGFCEADEDLMYYGKGQLLNESTRYLASGVTTETYKDDDNVEKKCYKFSYTASKGSTTDVVKYAYTANVGRPLTSNIEADKVYTLSFWAAAKGNNDFNLCAKFCLQPDTTEIISNIGKIIGGYSIDDKKGYIIEGVSNNGETNVYITEYWTQFFIYFYATNTVSFNSITSLDMLKLLGNDNHDGSYWSGNIYFCDFMFQEGYVLEPSSFVSKIEQNARCISLAQQTGLTKAGIDIYNGRVDVQADQFTIRNSSGQENMSVNETGDVEFRGVIKGTYNFKVQICDKSGNDTIKDDTDYFMFNVGIYHQTATLPNPMKCPGRVINISIINRPGPKNSNNEVFLYNYDNYTPFVWVDNTETPSSSEWKINFYDYRKIVVWSDPSLFARGFGWRIIDSEKWISQQDLTSNEAINALTSNEAINALKSNLQNSEVINTLVTVLQGKL